MASPQVDPRFAMRVAGACPVCSPPDATSSRPYLRLTQLRRTTKGCSGPWHLFWKGCHMMPTNKQDIASLPMRVGGSESDQRRGWQASSWADALPMLEKRLPPLAAEVTTILEDKQVGGCLGELLWFALQSGAHPRQQHMFEPGEWPHGWQYFASSASDCSIEVLASGFLDRTQQTTETPRALGWRSVSFFFEREREERKSVRQWKQNGKMDLSQAQCRTSAITSAKLGVGPWTATEALPSRNEVANARAAAQPIISLYLRVHADWARPRNKSETPRVSAQAKSLRNCAVSEEKRPSPASTTSLALPPLPATSGYVVSLSRQACFKAIPITSCALGQGVPSGRMELTSAVSTANWRR